MTNRSKRKSRISTKITTAATMSHVPLPRLVAVDFVLRFIAAPFGIELLPNPK